MVTYYAQVAQTSLKLMLTLAPLASSAFLAADMAARIAAFLNCFLGHAVGPKVAQLTALRGVGVSPVDFMAPLCRIAAALHGQSPLLAQALATDATSLPTLKTVATQIKDPFLGNPIVKLIKSLEEELARLEEEEPPADEIPDEFLDALTFILMKDPVRLPGSGTVLDRASIERHLRDHTEDPFTRAPLKKEDLEALPELKAKIEAWRAEKKKERKEKKEEGQR